MPTQNIISTLILIYLSLLVGCSTIYVYFNSNNYSWSSEWTASLVTSEVAGPARGQPQAPSLWLTDARVPAMDSSTLCSVGIQAAQPRPGGATSLQDTGRKRAQFYLLSPWQHMHHLHLLSSHFTEKAQIGVTAQFCTVAVWWLPRLFQNTDSLFTLPSGSRWTPGTDTESASNVLKHTLQTEEREHVDKGSKRGRADEIHSYLHSQSLSKINSHTHRYSSL